jgi:hypothetical protein
MDKFSLTMFKQVLSALSHMKELDDEHLKLVDSEIKRIRANLAPTPKKGCSGCGKKKQEFLKLQHEQQNSQAVT